MNLSLSRSLAVAVVTLGASAFSVPGEAEARPGFRAGGPAFHHAGYRGGYVGRPVYGRHHGGRRAAVIGGLAALGVLGVAGAVAAAQSPSYGYAPAPSYGYAPAPAYGYAPEYIEEPVYAPAPVYYAPAPVYAPAPAYGYRHGYRHGPRHYGLNRGGNRPGGGVDPARGSFR